MGFLHKLWDETLAGPAPEAGLGKLRKYDSFSAFRSPPIIPSDDIPVTRSITVLRTNSLLRTVSGDSSSAPSSPAGSSIPTSPFSPATTPRGDFKKLTRRKSSPVEFEKAEPRSLTTYDWIVMSALDR